MTTRKLFFRLLQAWFCDYDIVDQDEAREITIACEKIIRKYKTHDSRTKHITQELIDRNFIYWEEDEIWCREFIRWYFVWMSDR